MSSGREHGTERARRLRKRHHKPSPMPRSRVGLLPLIRTARTNALNPPLIYISPEGGAVTGLLTTNSGCAQLRKSRADGYDGRYHRARAAPHFSAPRVEAGPYCLPGRQIAGCAVRSSTFRRQALCFCRLTYFFLPEGVRAEAGCWPAARLRSRLAQGNKPCRAIREPEPATHRRPSPLDYQAGIPR